MTRMILALAAVLLLAGPVQGQHTILVGSISSGATTPFGLVDDDYEGGGAAGGPSGPEGHSANYSNQPGGFASIILTTGELALTGWHVLASLPTGPKNKNVKDGGCLVYNVEGVNDSPFVYAFKGNNRCEFYKYHLPANAWTSEESIPVKGRSEKKKTVKKGAALAAVGGIIYAVKGNNSTEFWDYTPDQNPGQRWRQLADVPSGAKNVKEGSGAVGVEIGANKYIYLLKGSGTTEFYRYGIDVGQNWTPMTSAPLGASGKPFKDGSCIAISDNGLSIYALKGSYNEFYRYGIDGNSWTTLVSLPMTGTGGRKKAKSGTCMAYHTDVLGSHFVYVLKGNNTQELWCYNEATGRWTEAPNIPLGAKRVKNGAALTSVRAGSYALYALKGNNTVEFYQYRPPPGGPCHFESGFKSAPQTLAMWAVPSAGLRIEPNPAVNAARVKFSLSRASGVRLVLFDASGQLVQKLFESPTRSGTTELGLDVSKLARGVYVVRLDGDGLSATQKLILE